MDQIEATEGPGILVTIGVGAKRFSTGFDLPFWQVDTMNTFSTIPMMQALLARFMTVSIPSVAVINGHAFAGGIILALAHDFRIMNSSNKGLICLSELNIGLALPTAYNEFIKRTMNPQAARMLSFGQAITPK